MIVLMWERKSVVPKGANDSATNWADGFNPLRESWNIFQQVKPYSYLGLTVDHFTAGKSFAMKAAAWPSLYVGMQFRKICLTPFLKTNSSVSFSVAPWVTISTRSSWAIPG